MMKYRVILKTRLRRTEYIVNANNVSDAEDEFYDQCNISFSDDEKDENGKPQFRLQITEIKE